MMTSQLCKSHKQNASRETQMDSIPTLLTQVLDELRELRGVAKTGLQVAHRVTSPQYTADDSVPPMIERFANTPVGESPTLADANLPQDTDQPSLASTIL